MKKIILVSAVALALSGCMTRQAINAIKQLKDDNATISAGYQGIYGNFYVIRSNPSTNHSATIDKGTVKIEPVEKK
jgi:hypothetical protein